MGRTNEPKGYPVGLVGESFYQGSIKFCRVGDPVTLLREPRNKHDPKAIAVVDKRWRTLGYIPRNCFVHDVVHEQGMGCAAEILNLHTNEQGPGDIGVVIDVTIAAEPLRER